MSDVTLGHGQNPSPAPASVPNPGTRLELLNMSKSYGPVHALRDVSLSATSGEVVAIVGDNGAGKSTLVKCLSGIVKPDSGRVVLNGEDVTVDSPKAAAPTRDRDRPPGLGTDRHARRHRQPVPQP